MSANAFRVATLAAFVLLAAGAAAGDDVGVPFGTNTVTSSITTVDGESDIDDYVSSLLKGESLSCTVVATGESALVPTLRLIDPSGADRTPTLKIDKGGKSLSFKSFGADVTGCWTVRIAGAADTQGPYTVAFRIKTPKRATRFGVAAETLGGGAPTTAEHTFEATRGAMVSISLRPLGRGNVSVESITDPAGLDDDPMFQALVTNKGRTKLKNFAVEGGDGTYTIKLGTTSPSVKYRLAVRVTVRARPRGKSNLSLPEPRLASLATPKRIAVGLATTLTGHDLSKTPPVRVLFHRTEGVVQNVSDDGKTVSVITPNIPVAALTDVSVQNPDGQSFTRSGVAYVVPAPLLEDIRDASGVSIRKVPVAGGDVLRIVGHGFDFMTRVFFGSSEVPITAVISANELRILAPPHARGPVTVSVEDDFGRTSSIGFTFSYVLPGWADGDGGRLPAATATDDFSAARAAVGEFGGGHRNDIVLVSPLHTSEHGFATHGTRTTCTRLLTQGADGVITDATAAKLPPGASMAFPYDLDDWNAAAVVIGDLDGANGDDIVIAGFSEVTSDGLSGGFFYGQNLFVSGVRALRGEGTGTLSLTPSEQAKPQCRRPPLNANDGNGVPRPLLGPFGDDRGDPTAIAIGDLDGDGVPDLVAAHSEFGFRRVVQDLTHVDFSKETPTIPTSDADAFVLGTDVSFAYVSGTEILRNLIPSGGSLTDVTDLAMPLSFGGDAAPDGPAEPGYHADDVALADIDGDGDLDMVLVWHDPTTVSVRGLKSSLQSVYDGVSPPVSLDGPRVATRVLVNGGNGRFTDATAAWMPAGSSSEWWQGDRISLTDLDGDDAPDLVILSRDGVDAWTTTALAPISATSVAGTVSPGDLGAAETESYEFNVPADGRYVAEVSLGTLADSVLTLVSPTGVEAASDDDDGSGLGSRIVRDLTPGTWKLRVSGYSPTDFGTFTLSVLGRPTASPAVPRAHTSLRVLRNDRVAGKFVDVTTFAVPAPPAGDDFRGGALYVGDADADGRMDIIVATTDALFDGAARISSLRLLHGLPGLAFALDTNAVPAVAEDSGEAEDVRLVPPAAPGSPPSLLLVSRVKPFASQGGRYTRMFDWNR